LAEKIPDEGRKGGGKEIKIALLLVHNCLGPALCKPMGARKALEERAPSQLEVCGLARESTKRRGGGRGKELEVLGERDIRSTRGKG